MSAALHTDMFSLKNKYTLEKPIHKINFIKYNPSSLATINNTNSSISISFPREDAYICLQNSFISLEFEVLKNNNTRYADADEIGLVNFGPISLFSEAKLTTSSGKHLEKVDNLHLISLMYKLLTSTKSTSELLYGFEESTSVRRQELTNNKNEKGTFFVRIKLKDLFGFADQEKITYGLGYTLTLKRNTNNDAILRSVGVDAAKVVIKDIGWYIPHYVPSLENQQFVMDQILNKDPTEIFFTERIIFRKDVNTISNWTFELGSAGGNSNNESCPTFVIVGFQARNKIDSQVHDNSVFDRLPISNAVCKIGSEKYPDDGIECDYDRDKYDQANSEIENFYHLHSETNLLNPFIDLHKFRTKYPLFVFDLSKQKDQIASQPIRLEFKFNAAIDVANFVAYALVLTPKLISISSDGQRHFDLI